MSTDGMLSSKIASHILWMKSLGSRVASVRRAALCGNAQRKRAKKCFFSIHTQVDFRGRVKAT